jgi:hypothetical protein
VTPSGSTRADAHPTSRSTGRTWLDGSRPGLIISANC